MLRGTKTLWLSVILVVASLVGGQPRAELLLEEHFNSDVIPTMVLLDPKGKEIRRNVGYMAATDFINFLKT